LNRGTSLFLVVVVVVALAVFAFGFGRLGRAANETAVETGTSTLGPDISCAAEVPATCSHANLTSADFIGFNLTGANFTGADLDHAKFNFAYLVDATFNGANVANADFTEANLTGSSFIGSNLQMAVLCNTVLPNGTNSTADC